MALRVNRERGQSPREAGDGATDRAAAVAAAAAAAEDESAAGSNGRSRRGWIMLVLVLGVAAVALLVLERVAGPPVSPVPAQMLHGEPDMYMEAPVISQYRSDGTLEYRLEAAQAAHFQPDALVRLQEPRLTLFQPQAEPWTVSARRGSLQRPPGIAEETVVLDDDVTLRQPRAGGTIRLMTATLRLFPQRRYAETDEDVIIEGLFGRTTATGLKGDLERGLLDLQSLGTAPVRTVLQPEHFK